MSAKSHAPSKSEHHQNHVRSRSRSSFNLSPEIQPPSHAEIRNILSSHQVQAKLTINDPNDKYEQEADRVADQVMRMPEPSVQRMCTDCEEELHRQPAQEEEEELQLMRMPEPEIQRMCTDCEEELHRQPLDDEEEELVQASEMPGQTPQVNSAVESGINAIRGGGAPLPDSSRSFFEPRFGQDFSNVRVHADARAAELASSINARAFTLGRDIVFGTGQYQPHSQMGQQLMAHELTHVVQQGSRMNTSTIHRQVLTEAGRRLLVEQARDDMGAVDTDLTGGAILAEQDVQDAARANADAAKAIFGILMAVVVPGLGGQLTRIAGGIGVTLSSRTASHIGNAVGELAKNEGNKAIDKTHSVNPRKFFSAITSGFEAAKRKELGWIRSNVNNRVALPDHVLQERANFWQKLASDYEQPQWASWFVNNWKRYKAQVGEIGPKSLGLVPFGPQPQSNENIPVYIQFNTGRRTRLALVNKTRIDRTSNLDYLMGTRKVVTLYRFIRWIDDDLASLAISKAGIPPRISAHKIQSVP